MSKHVHDGCNHDAKAPEIVRHNSELIGEDLVETIFTVSGMDCADEVSAINSALRQKEVAEVNANIMTGTVRIRHLPMITENELAKRVESAGVKIQRTPELDTHAISQRRILLAAAAGIFLSVGLAVDYFFDSKPAALSFFVLSVISGGTLVVPKAFRSLRQARLDINVLMAIAAAGAFVIQEYSEGATVVFLFAVSELLESYSVARARRAIREVMDLAPQTAFKVDGNGDMTEVPAASINANDVVWVKSGGRIPVDGIVKSGASLVNQAPLTGESVPVQKVSGDEVYAGTMNESGALEILVTQAFRNSKASQIVRMIEDAQRDKAPAQRFVDTFARYYTPSVFVAAILIFVVPTVFLSGDWFTWLYRALVLLVIACPCALVISTPVSIVSGLASMARRGILVKGGVYLEMLGRIRALAVDKTGTITTGKPSIASIHPFAGTEVSKIVEIAVSLEAFSTHPLALAITEYAKSENISSKRATDFNTVVGYGVEAKIDGHEYFLGNHRFAHEIGVCKPELESLLESLEEKSFSIVVVGHKPHAACEGEVLGVIAIGDKIRENASKAIEALKKIGIEHVIMLSGDNQKTAAAIANQVGINDVRAGLLPEDKVAEIKKMISMFGQVAMIGDGINDAPALAASSIGIAMGVGGTDTALETADVALMKDDLEGVATAIQHGRRVLSIVKFNIGLALAVKAVFLVLALSGHTNLWLAVAADTGTSLLVVANALRLLR